MSTTESSRRAWIAIACASLVGFSMFGTFLCVSPIGHVVRKEFHITYAQLGLLIAIPPGVLAVAAIPAGMLADRIGVKKATVIGTAMMAIGSLLRGTTTDYRLLCLFTGLFGLGFTLVYPNLAKIVHGWFTREKVGLATAIYSTGMALGSTIPYVITLPLLLPITNSSQGVFFAWSVPAIAAFILCWIALEEPPRAQERHTALGESETPALLRDRNLWLAALLMVSNAVHFYVWVTWTPALMMQKGMTPEVASTITSIRGWAALPSTFLVSLLSYKVGLRKPFLWGSGLLLALICLWAISMSAAWGWLLMVLVGVLGSGIFSMILALPVELPGKRSFGLASGMMLSIGYTGGLIAPWLAGYLFDISGTWDWSLIGLAVVSLGWALVGALIPETGTKSSLRANKLKATAK